MRKIKQFGKKVNKGEEKNNSSQRDELKNLIIVIAAVIVIFLIFYTITVLINPKKEDQPTQTVAETIQYEKILVGEMLNRNEKDYYVLVKNSDNVYNDLYKMYLQMYNTKKATNIYYVVDLEDVFNQSYIGDETKVTGNVSEYQFNDSVLIKVKKNKLDTVYNGHDNIVAALEKLIK